jgi:hypothetical protein
MCLVKTPKVETPKEKEPTIIRNPYLDGADPVMRAQRSGRSGLKIERGVAGSPLATAPEPTPGSTLAPTPTADTPVTGFKMFGAQAAKLKAKLGNGQLASAAAGSNMNPFSVAGKIMRGG